jgi:hypothetical protein
MHHAMIQFSLLTFVVNYIIYAIGINYSSLSSQHPQEKQELLKKNVDNLAPGKGHGLQYSKRDINVAENVFYFGDYFEIRRNDYIRVLASSSELMMLSLYYCDKYNYFCEV